MMAFLYQRSLIMSHRERDFRTRTLTSDRISQRSGPYLKLLVDFRHELHRCRSAACCWNFPRDKLVILALVAPVKRNPMKRLLWLDIAKGLAILWIVYFHFIHTYLDHRPVPPDNWNGFFESAVTASRMAWLKISGLGLHAVGVFIILNGWALMQSTARRAAAGPMAWGQWYRARLFRLYPMYWVAHLVYLISPFVARWEQVDRRIVLSLLGLRFINIEVNFYYLNASWWFFSMIIQFYFIFPFALSHGATTRTLDFPSRRVRNWILRALSHAHCLSAKRCMDTRRFCH